MATPWIVFGFFCYSATHRIEMKVGNQFEKMRMGIDKNGFIPALKKVPRSIEAHIDPTRITKREVLHNAGKGNVADLDGQMDMVCHETKREDTMTVPFDTFLNEKKKPATVFGVGEDVLASITAKDDMVQRAGIMKTGFTSHEKNITSGIDIAIFQA
jgi:hypothetical protein